ncbi:MAG: hypothetical protein OXH70_11245 [Acidobacteria bacterium]|nr:hypothetical protein [Acidobacteriota bacterium]
MSLRTGRVEFVPYQYRPVLKLIRSDQPRLVIADEVGVGKTIEAGLIIKELRARSGLSSVLVICPKPLVSERKWELEMRRFDERFHPLDGHTLRFCINETHLDGEWPRRYSNAILPMSLLNLLRPDLIVDPPTFEQMAAPNGHINRAIALCRGGRPGWREAAGSRLDSALETEWGRGLLRASPLVKSLQETLRARGSEDESRVRAVDALEGLYTFGRFINRTRRRDIGEFTTRKPQTVAVPYTSAQRALHDRLMETLARILAACHGRRNVRFMMSTVRRQAASCLYGLAPYLGLRDLRPLSASAGHLRTRGRRQRRDPWRARRGAPEHRRESQPDSRGDTCSPPADLRERDPPPREEEERMEGAQGELFGLGQLVADWASEIENAESPWLTPDAIRRLVNLYLQRLLESPERNFLEGSGPIRTLRLSADAKRKLLAFLDVRGRRTDSRFTRWENWLRGASSRLGVAFRQDAARESDEVVHLDATHSLVQQAATLLATGGGPRPSPPARVCVSAPSPTAPAGDHAFAVYRWRKTGVVQGDEFVAVCSSPEAEGVVLRLLADASDDSGHDRIDDSALKALDGRHHEPWNSARERHVADNARIVDHRLQSLEVSHRARERILNDHLASAVHENLRRMRRAQLEDAARDREDGRPFSRQNLENITNYFRSAKYEREDKIGRFGIGFKSVFACTETPRIRSGAAAFEIVDRIVPKPLPRAASPPCSRTVIELPFNGKMKTVEEVREELGLGLERLPAMSVLHLENTESIEWRTARGDSRSIKRGKLAAGLVRVDVENARRGYSATRRPGAVARVDAAEQSRRETHWFLRFREPHAQGSSKHLDVVFELRRKEAARKALPVNDGSPGHQFRIVPSERGRVAVFFPAEKETSNLRFHLHAPFIPELSRASIKEHPDNAALIGRLAELVARSLPTIRDLGLLDREFLGVPAQLEGPDPRRIQVLPGGRRPCAAPRAARPHAGRRRRDRGSRHLLRRGRRRRRREGRASTTGRA